MSKRFFLPVLTALLVSSLTLTAQDIPVVNIENPVVQLFMSKGPYEAFGSQESYFANTVDFPVRYAQDKPAGFLLNWEGNDNAQYTLTLKVSEGSSQKTVFKEKIQGTSYVLTNLYPQKTYSYSVKKGMKTILKGSFRTEGQVRMLDIEDSCNARDLGGWTGLDGRKIRYGLLFRTASIDGAYATECNGLLIYADQGSYSPRRWAFHGPQSDSLDKRVRLEIVYSLLND